MLRNDDGHIETRRIRLTQRGVFSIVEDVAKEYVVPVDMMLSAARTRSVSRARHEAWRRIYDLGLSSSEVAWLWKCCSTSVRHARMRSKKEGK